MGVASSSASQARARATRRDRSSRPSRRPRAPHATQAAGRLPSRDAGCRSGRVLAMHLQHPNPALLKRPGSRGGGGGGGLGTLHPMSVSGQRGRFVPVALVVVFMFFVAVYRCADRPRLDNDRIRHLPSAPSRRDRPLTQPPNPTPPVPAPPLAENPPCSPSARTSPVP